MQMVLTPLDGGEPVVLDKAILLFGRHADCDVVLSTSRKVSRKHCCLAQIHNDIVVRDLASMNGVRVNGIRVDREARLKPGDELWIGDVGFRLDVVAVTRRPATAPPAGSSSPVRNAARPEPDLVSSDVPIAIPENDEGLLADDDIPLTAPASRKPRPSRSRKVNPRSPESDEVIVLSDEDIVS